MWREAETCVNENQEGTPLERQCHWRKYRVGFLWCYLKVCWRFFRWFVMNLNQKTKWLIYNWLMVNGFYIQKKEKLYFRELLDNFQDLQKQSWLQKLNDFFTVSFQIQEKMNTRQDPKPKKSIKITKIKFLSLGTFVTNVH